VQRLISPILHARAARLFDSEPELPLLALPLALILAIALYFALPTEPPQLLTAGLLLTSLAARIAAHRSIPGRALTNLCLAATLGFAAAQLHAAYMPPWDLAPNSAPTITGQITDIDILPKGRRITLTAAGFARQIRLRLRDSDTQSIHLGDTVSVRALLEPPSPPVMPGTRDLAREAWFSGLGFYGFAIAPAQILDHAPPGRHFEELRQTIAARLRAALPGTNGAIAVTLFCGEGAQILAATRSEFAAAGLAHILAVAGLHLGIVMGFVFFLTRYALALPEKIALTWPTRRIASGAALIAGFFYMALTGAHLPILRSFFIACLAMIALLAGRRVMSLRALGTAAALLAVADPILITGVSYQMSFSAVLALITGYDRLWPYIAAHFAGRHSLTARFARALAALSLTSALAGGASLPFAAAHFGTAGLAFVPANLIAVPLTAFWILPLGLLALLLMPLHLEILALAPMGWGIHLLCFLAHAISTLPGAMIPIKLLPSSVLVLFSLGLFVFCATRTRFLRRTGLVLITAALVRAIFVPAPDIVVSPNGQVVVVNLPGNPQIFETHHKNRFAREQILAALGLRAETTAQQNVCTQGICDFEIQGKTIEVLQNPDATPDCARTALIVSTAQIGDPCPGVTIMDAKTPGIAYITSGGIKIIPNNEGQFRPWARKENTLPFAPTE